MSDREKPNLDAALRRHYRGKSLPAARIDEILGAGARTSSPRSSVYYWLTGVAAVLVVGFTGVYTAMHHSFTQAVYREVAMNHRKQLAVEVAAQQYEAGAIGTGEARFLSDSESRRAPGDRLRARWRALLLDPGWIGGHS